MLTLRSVVKTSILLAMVALQFKPAPAQVSCGDVLTANSLLTQDLTCAADGLRIGAVGVTLDCAGHEIRGPGTTIGVGVSALDVSGATITRCHITGFRTAIQGQRSADLQVTHSVLSGQSGGIRCAECPRATIEGNQIQGHLAQIELLGSPDSRITGNVTRPYSKGGGHFVLRASPRAVISGNRAPEGGAGIFMDRCDDSAIEDNDLARNATIELYNSARCRIVRNTLVHGAAPQPNFGGMVRLNGSSDNLIQGNWIEGSLGLFLTAGPQYPPTGGVVYVGADRNTIVDNVVSDSGYGLLLFGASENRISRNRIERTELGIGVYGLFDPDPNLDVPSDNNTLAANTLRGGLFGIGTWRTSGNMFRGNEILDHQLGCYEGPVGPFSMSPNVYVENAFANNRFFGLVAVGGSPLLDRNEFHNNGAPDAVPADLEPYRSLLGDHRGGIALLPLVGDDSALDNAHPDDDVLAEPRVGGPGQKNLFTDNYGIDIFALDTRATNASTLERDNHFKGDGRVHIRQDWFGLVRVEDSAGNPVANAKVEVRDATGALVAAFTTGTSGIGPSSADLSRSQGRTALEDGGPVPPWPGFTEFVVDDRGRTHELTPHMIFASSSGEAGCAIFAWDGIPRAPLGSTNPDGRYQIALVRLGSTCTAPLDASRLRQ